MGKSNKTSATTVVAQTIAFPRNQFPPLLISSVPLKNLMFLASYCGPPMFCTFDNSTHSRIPPFGVIAKGKKTIKIIISQRFGSERLPPRGIRGANQSALHMVHGRHKRHSVPKFPQHVLWPESGNMPRTPRFCNIITIHMYIAIYIYIHR